MKEDMKDMKEDMKGMETSGGKPLRPHALHLLHVLHVTALLTGLSAAAACTSGPPPPVTDPASYERTVAAFRADKNAAFRAPGNDLSPILPADRAAFPGLSYYPIDPKYRVPGFLKEERPDPPVVIELQTSINTRRRMRRVGTLGFTLGTTPYTLTAFADVDLRTFTRLFVPYGDLTNVDATYKGGRYLDLDRTPTGLYDVDFNRAYHPYCVYNPSYECPVPPRENRLTAPILAGERLGAAK